MKHYINNIPIESGEITVLMNQNAETVTHHACKTAEALRQHNLGVLLLNCATSGRRFNQAAEKHITDASRNRRPFLYTRTMEKGNLAAEKNYIEGMIDAGMNVIIISGWEWTSDSYRRNKKLQHLLREWAERKGVAIVIYSQARTEPTVGEYDRGGLGWLASIAYAIQRIDLTEDTSNIPKPPPLITTEEDCAAADRSAQLMADLLTTYDESSQMSKVKSQKREEEAA